VNQNEELTENFSKFINGAIEERLVSWVDGFLKYVDRFGAEEAVAYVRQEIRNAELTNVSRRRFPELFIHQERSDDGPRYDSDGYRIGTDSDAIEYNTAKRGVDHWNEIRPKSPEPRRTSPHIAPSTHMRDHWAARKNYESRKD
jgi:hypothetical protein